MHAIQRSWQTSAYSCTTLLHLYCVLMSLSERVSHCTEMWHCYNLFIHKCFCSPVCCLFSFHPFLCKCAVFLFSSCDQSANKLWGRVLSAHLCPNNISVLLISFGVFKSVLLELQNIGQDLSIWSWEKVYAGVLFSILGYVLFPAGHHTGVKKPWLSFYKNWPLRSVAAESFILCVNWVLLKSKLIFVWFLRTLVISDWTVI